MMKTTCVLATLAAVFYQVAALPTQIGISAEAINQVKNHMDGQVHASLFDHYHKRVEPHNRRRTPSLGDRVLDGMFTSDCYQFADPTHHTNGNFSALQTILYDHNYIGPSNIYLDLVIYTGGTCNPSTTDVLYKEIMNGTVKFETALSGSATGDVGLVVVIHTGYYYTLSQDLVVTLNTQCGRQCGISWGIGKLVFGNASRCTMEKPINPTFNDLCKRISGTPFFSKFSINGGGHVLQNTPSSIETQGFSPNPNQPSHPLIFIQQGFNTNRPNPGRVQCLGVSSTCSTFLTGGSGRLGAINFCKTCDRLNSNMEAYPGPNLECDGCMYRYGTTEYNPVEYKDCCPCYSYFAVSNQDPAASFLANIQC